MADQELKFKEESDGSLIIEGLATNAEDDKVAGQSADTGDSQSLKESAQGAGEDERLTQGEEGGEEEQGHAEETPEEAEARRQRNRTRREQNKQSRKNYIESLRRELAARDEMISELSTRVASVEQQSVGNQMAQLDAAISEAGNYYNHFKMVNQKAIEMADGAAASDAQEKMFAARQRVELLQNAKRQMNNQTVKAPSIDPRVASKAQAWIENNKWYDPSGKDADSEIAMTIDRRMASEGWNPTTEEYWEELDARIKKHLPHRAFQSNNSKQTKAPRVPVSGGGSEGSNVAPRGVYRLSAERVAALKEAGIYDDPVKRADMIRRYQEEDRRNGQTK